MLFIYVNYEQFKKKHFFLSASIALRSTNVFYSNLSINMFSTLDEQLYQICSTLDKFSPPLETFHGQKTEKWKVRKTQKRAPEKTEFFPLVKYGSKYTTVTWKI